VSGRRGNWFGAGREPRDSDLTRMRGPSVSFAHHKWRLFVDLRYRRQVQAASSTTLPGERSGTVEMEWSQIRVSVARVSTCESPGASPLAITNRMAPTASTGPAGGAFFADATHEWASPASSGADNPPSAASTRGFATGTGREKEARQWPERWLALPPSIPPGERAEPGEPGEMGLLGVCRPTPPLVDRQQPMRVDLTFERVEERLASVLRGRPRVVHRMQPEGPDAAAQSRVMVVSSRADHR
jgi:hypothetical protein